jgi:cytochrome c550
MVEEKTDVMMSVYVEAALARNTFVKLDLTVPRRYDRPVSTPEQGWPLRRIVLLPLVLFVLVSAAAFTLAKLHLAKPKAEATAAAPATLGNPGRGLLIFRQSCGGCHGLKAEGGVGPRLAGAHITLGAVKAQIDNGGGIMPAHLVTGGREDDVLAYLAKILAP